MCCTERHVCLRPIATTLNSTATSCRRFSAMQRLRWARRCWVEPPEAGIALMGHALCCNRRHRSWAGGGARPVTCCHSARPAPARPVGAGGRLARVVGNVVNSETATSSAVIRERAGVPSHRRRGASRRATARSRQPEEAARAPRALRVDGDGGPGVFRGG